MNMVLKYIGFSLFFAHLFLNFINAGKSEDAILNIFSEILRCEKIDFDSLESNIKEYLKYAIPAQSIHDEVKRNISIETKKLVNVLQMEPLIKRVAELKSNSDFRKKLINIRKNMNKNNIRSNYPYSWSLITKVLIKIGGLKVKSDALKKNVQNLITVSKDSISAFDMLRNLFDKEEGANLQQMQQIVNGYAKNKEKLENLIDKLYEYLREEYSEKASSKIIYVDSTVNRLLQPDLKKILFELSQKFNTEEEVADPELELRFDEERNGASARIVRLASNLFFITFSIGIVGTSIFLSSNHLSDAIEIVESLFNRSRDYIFNNDFLNLEI